MTETTRTIKTIQLTAKETGDILCGALAEKLDASGELGDVTAGSAKDLDGLAAEVTLTFFKGRTA